MATPTKSQQIDSVSLKLTAYPKHMQAVALHHIAADLSELMERKGPLRKISVVRAFQSALETIRGKQ